jgi:hypothetical protein
MLFLHVMVFVVTFSGLVIVPEHADIFVYKR